MSFKVNTDMQEDWDFSKEYSTWIIAYCIDLDTFFITRERGFYWEHEKTFNSNLDAVQYFENNINEFVSIKNSLLMQAVQFYKPESRVWLANTEKWYYVEMLR